MASPKTRPNRPKAATTAPTTPAAPDCGFYSQELSDEEQRALRSLGDSTLRDEIALLRVLVRRELGAGATTESIRRLIREIGMTVKVDRSAGASDGGAIQLALDDALTKLDGDSA